MTGRSPALRRSRGHPAASSPSCPLLRGPLMTPTPPFLGGDELERRAPSRGAEQPPPETFVPQQAGDARERLRGARPWRASARSRRRGWTPAPRRSRRSRSASGRSGPRRAADRRPSIAPWGMATPLPTPVDCRRSRSPSTRSMSSALTPRLSCREQGGEPAERVRLRADDPPPPARWRRIPGARSRCRGLAC